MANFHISDLNNFTKCRYQWFMSSHLRMGKGTEAKEGPMFKGTQGHLGFEHYYHNTPQPYIEPENQAIVDHYIQWAKKNDNFQGIVNTELSVSVPFFTDDKGVQHTVNSRLDLVVYYKNKIWINDFKVTGMDFDNYSDYINNQDSQARCYSWMGRQLWGSNFGGIMFTLVRNKAPEYPKTISGGRLSKDKRQNTTWEMYKEAIHALELKESDYEDMRIHLQSNDYIRRIYMKFGNKALDNFYHRAKLIALEMIKEGDDLILYPTNNVMTCRYCQYRDPCNAWMDFGKESGMKSLNMNFRTTKYVQNARDEVLNNQLETDGETE